MYVCGLYAMKMRILLCIDGYNDAILINHFKFRFGFVSHIIVQHTHFSIVARKIVDFSLSQINPFRKFFLLAQL